MLRKAILFRAAWQQQKVGLCSEIGVRNNTEEMLPYVWSFPNQRVGHYKCRALPLLSSLLAFFSSIPLFSFLFLSPSPGILLPCGIEQSPYMRKPLCRSQPSTPFTYLAFIPASLSSASGLLYHLAQLVKPWLHAPFSEL